MRQPLTVDENSFQNPKPAGAALVAYKALADVAGKASLFVITIVAARRLSSEAFGLFAVGSTLGWMLAVAADCGLQMHLARAVARAPADARARLSTWLPVRLWMGAGSLAVGAGVMAVWRPDAGAVSPIALLVLAYACSGIVEFFYYFFRGLARVDIEASATIAHRTGTLGLALAVLMWQPTITALAAAMLMPAAIAAVICWSIARKLRPPVEEGSEDRSLHGLPAGHVGSERPGRTLRTEFRRDVLPIGVGIVLSALYFRIDVFLVQAWSGAGAVASYNAVFRLVEALRLFPAAVLAVALPLLCRATHLRPLAGISAIVTGVGVVVTVVLWLAAPWAVPLIYGAPYAGAASAFRILLLAFPLMSLNYALTNQLIAWNGHRAFAVLCAIALVFNVALNARLIPTLSIDGAAWTTVGTEAVLTIGCGIALVRATRSNRGTASIGLAEQLHGAAL